MNALGGKNFRRLGVGLVQPQNPPLLAASADQQLPIGIHQQRIHIGIIQIGNRGDLFILQRQNDSLRAGAGVNRAIGRFGQGIHRRDLGLLLQQRLDRARELHIAEVGGDGVVELPLFKISLGGVIPMRCAVGKGQRR